MRLSESRLPRTFTTGSRSVCGQAPRSSISDQPLSGETGPVGTDLTVKVRAARSAGGYASRPVDWCTQGEQ